VGKQETARLFGQMQLRLDKEKNTSGTARS
jgi:hypothetical protein